MEKPSIETSQHILSNLPIAITITDDAGLILWCNKMLSDWMGKEPGHCVGSFETSLLNGEKPAPGTGDIAAGLFLPLMASTPFVTSTLPKKRFFAMSGLSLPSN